MAIGSMAPVVATPSVAMAELTGECRVGPHRSREGPARRPALGRIAHVDQQLQDSSDTRSRLDAQPCVSEDIGLHVSRLHVLSRCTWARLLPRCGVLSRMRQAASGRTLPREE